MLPNSYLWIKCVDQMESIANPVTIGGAKRQLKFLILQKDYEPASYG